MAAFRVNPFHTSASSVRLPAADHPANIDLGMTQPIDITASLTGWGGSGRAPSSQHSPESAAVEHRSALYGDERA